MIIATHAIVGGALAGALNSNPFISFAVGMVSHYPLDWLPHWDYNLKSAEVDEENPLKNSFSGGRDYYFDLVKIGFDLVLGFLLAMIFFINWQDPMSFINIGFGALGGIFPDFLQFIYMKLKVEPFASMQKLHFFFHTKIKLKDKPFLGISLQLALVIFALLIGNWRLFIW